MDVIGTDESIENDDIEEATVSVNGQLHQFSDGDGL